MATHDAASDVEFVASDGAIRVETSVKRRLGGRLHDFRVLAREGGLILRGWTHTYYAKQLAQQAVMEATRLPILANDIEVT